MTDEARLERLDVRWVEPLGLGFVIFSVRMFWRLSMWGEDWSRRGKGEVFM